MAPTEADPRIVVILNAASGMRRDKQLPRHLLELLQAHGLKARLILVRGGGNVSAMAQTAVQKGSKLIITGGGDGTLSAVASALVGTDAVLGVLALGTFNHFAKDLQIPLDWREAVRIIAAGKVTQVDVGEVNGRIFINNSSVGLYPKIVFRRQALQRAGHGKWAALFWATLAVFRRLPFLHVRVKIDGQELLRTTPFVFVGNNEYEIDGAHPEMRNGLNRGHLCLYTAQPTSRLELVWLSVRALARKLSDAKNFDNLNATEVLIEVRRRRIRVSLDGETSVLTTPLLYRSRPGALKVIVP